MILETMSWILKNVNVGVDRLIVGYGVRFVYSEVIRSYCPNINAVFIGFLKRILTSGNHQGISAKIAADKAIQPVGFRCCAIMWQYRN